MGSSRADRRETKPIKSRFCLIINGKLDLRIQRGTKEGKNENICELEKPVALECTNGLSGSPEPYTTKGNLY